MAAPLLPNPPTPTRLRMMVIVATIAVIASVLALIVVPGSATDPAGAASRARRATLATGDLVFDSDRTGAFQIFTMHADGSGARPLTSNPKYDHWWARLSPNRQTIIYYRTPKGVHDSDYTKTALWAMNVDGSNQHRLRSPGTDGWVLQGHADFSPDGAHLVMFGGSKMRPQIYVTDTSGAHPVAITDRPGQNLDPSWSPDGSSVLFISCPTGTCPSALFEVYEVPATGGTATRLTTDDLQDQDPRRSPDRSRVAWLTRISVGVWDIRTTTGSGAPTRLLGDNQVNSMPSWSADSSTIYFHRYVSGSGRGFDVWAVSPDGSHLRNLTPTVAGQSEYPSG